MVFVVVVTAVCEGVMAVFEGGCYADVGVSDAVSDFAQVVGIG